MRRISLNILAPPPTIECKAIRASRPGKSHPNCLTSVYRGVVLAVQWAPNTMHMHNF